ncbi:MAG TPA: GC-type dockerin domain-anchored protein [Phycisphaerales bacterium]|nr:GC-type dockerin domain-anchored protein [Phycisphaerales bacterium]HRQ76582.1 GC-type dockerin domain-anchored protein [Phycisphaerales bacterium]
MTASTPVSADPPRYRIINLGSLDCLDGSEECAAQDTFSKALGINNLGEVVGYSYTQPVQPGAKHRAFIWLYNENQNYPNFNGVPPALLPPQIMHELPGAFNQMAARDINIDGVIVGSTFVGNDEKDGTSLSVSLLSPNPGYVWNLTTSPFYHHTIEPFWSPGFASAYGVNDENPPVIVGVSSFFPTQQMPYTAVGFRIVYDDGEHSTMGELYPPFLVESHATAYGVAPPGSFAGHAVGHCTRPIFCAPGGCNAPQECQRAPYWDWTQPVEFPSILKAVHYDPPEGIYSETIVRGMNTVGNIVGSSYTTFGGTACIEKVAFWLDPTANPVPMYQKFSRGFAIAAPMADGTLRVVGADLEKDHAMLWTKPTGESWQAIDLNDINNPNQNHAGDVEHIGDEQWVQLWRAYDINDYGWIVGYGEVQEEQPPAFPVWRAFLMFPIDETTCPADLTGTGGMPDGVVDVLDLLALLGAWGPCPGGGAPCAADLNNSGAVDVQDLLILLAAWGPCPNQMPQEVLTLNEVLDSAGLTQQQFNDYLSVMMGTNEKEKVRWNCWFNNRIMQCAICPACPGTDPFAN